MTKTIKSRIYNRLSTFPYLSKGMILLADLFIVAFSFSLIYTLTFYLTQHRFSSLDYLLSLGICLLIYALSFSVFKTYTGILRYSTFRDALRLLLATFCASIVMGLIFVIKNALGWEGLPAVALLINFVVTFALVFIFRMSVKLVYEFARGRTKRYKTPILINGTDPHLIDFAKVLNNGDIYKVVGFISRDGDIVDKRLMGLPIYSNAEVRKRMPDRSHFKSILIDPRSIERGEKQRLADLCITHDIEMLSIPSSNDWKEKSGKETKLNKINIEDLLGRIPIAIDTESIAQKLKSKTVMVTGAAGSIGSELVRQLASFEVGLILLCDQAETPLHELSLEMNEKFPNIKYISKICNVQDYSQMKHIMEKYKPNHIFHAAAYKHVPLMENHPCEAIMTNVLGTKNVIDLAVENGVETFVMISTDKAVNPSNVMGASKRIAEIYVQSLHAKLKEEQKNPIRIITTRFGNVLGSNGSVIPLFKKQIEKGGPITVTHQDIIRYFMTIREACRLVLEAGNFGKGGEVFLFDMGESVKIKDMAERMIRLAGYEPYKDIDIIFTGLRPGEKLFEELLYDKEKVQPTHNRKIMIGSVPSYDFNEISVSVDKLIQTTRTYNKVELVKVMKKIVPEFKSLNSTYSDLD
ncbi:polysaccharide biosynthesis protein [Bacteroidales bacterium OttesenSCG-928-A17]|nr:polysaccharide biosynthesis protein [Bacteroidales bacterium OttesenSCG-928-A17]